MSPTSDHSVALGKLLLIQHALEVLPNETSIASFLCRSLSTIPGVNDVHVCLRGVVTPDNARYRELCSKYVDCSGNIALLDIPPLTKHFLLRTQHHIYGALFLSIYNEEQFSQCQPYVANTANTVATLLESRDHVHELNMANESIQRGRDELEVRVKQRTADLLRANEELQHEMSERKVVEEKNQRLTQLYAALSQCNEAIVRCTSEDELFPKVCRSAVEFGGMMMAWIGLVDEASQRVKPVASYGEGVEYLEDIQVSTDADDPAGCGPIGIAIRENRPFWCQDFQHDPSTAPWHERSVRFGWAAAATLPLLRNGIVIGNFTLYSNKINAFDEAARNLMVEMAVDISFALDNFSREIARRQTELALADSQSLLKTIIDTAPMRIFWKNKESRYLGCNPAFAKDAGEDQTENLIGKDDYQLNWREQAELYRADDREVIDTGVAKLFYDEHQTTPDGKTIWLSTSKVPLYDAADKMIGVLGIYEDISERKLTEIALQRSEDNLNRAQAIAQVGSWYLDVNTNRLDWSEETYRIFGIPKQETIDLDTWISAIHPDDREMVLKSWNEALSGAVYDVEHRVVVDGNTRWVREQAKIEMDCENRPISGIGTVHDITERKQAEERIQFLAYFDQLTGLPNQTLFIDRINHAISMSQRSNVPLSVLYLDLDQFKIINDTLGHTIGDALLIKVAERLKSALREEDIISRQGGDEFIIVLLGTDVAGAAHVANNLLKTVAHSYQVEQYELNITSSIGIAMYPSDGKDFESLFKCIDIAMYRSKHNGRNNYQFFTQEMQKHSARTLQLDNALRNALEYNQLHLHYQPQISLHDGRIVGVEALLRWQHPELGTISPSEFIPIAEASGLILQIGEWVLRSAALQLKKWIDSGLEPMVIAVNLSVVQFRHAQLPELVMHILKETGLPPQYLELELTEGIAMDDPFRAIAVMDNLHNHGIRMSIDDFGTGYSSLAYLKRFQIYKLKIDQSFVRDIAEDLEDRAIVTAIISMANNLGMQTIAEGVETSEQLELLRLLGCNEVQGYYFSKPLPADQFEVHIRSNEKSYGLPTLW